MQMCRSEHLGHGVPIFKYDLGFDFAIHVFSGRRLRRVFKGTLMRSLSEFLSSLNGSKKANASLSCRTI